MKLKLKTKIGICPCSPPVELYAVTHDENGKVVKRGRITNTAIIANYNCPHCHKPWDEH